MGQDRIEWYQFPELLRLAQRLEGTTQRLLWGKASRPFYIYIRLDRPCYDPASCSRKKLVDICNTL